MDQQITVENIKCGGCVNSIQSALLKLGTVEKVTIDIETGIISVFGDISKEQLVNKLDSLGYPEKGNNTLLRKAKSYVSCAIGRMN